MSKESKLVERAASDNVVPALIQNGNDPGCYTESGAILVQRADKSSVAPALIQNGSRPTKYTESGA